MFRAIRLRCPACGRGRIFRGLFFTEESCPECGLKVQREPGFFLGSIYINYGLTALVIAIAYPILMLNELVAEPWLMIGLVTFTIVFPIFFFRYSRSLLLGWDQFADPRPTIEDQKKKD